MSLDRGVRLTILVEDEALKRFVTRVFREFGFQPRHIYVIAYPIGRGSAKQWVTQRFPAEVKLHRSKVTYQNVGLIVGTDADELPVADRLGQLAASLEASGLSPRSDREPVAIWIPKWSIETWLLFLSGQSVHEGEDFKREAKEIDLRAVASAFVARYRDWRTQPDQSPSLLPSLIAGFHETSRLEP